jgi:choline kinase
MRELTAIILAAGAGKRLGAGLGDQPKALLEVGGETLIARLIRQLRAALVERVVVVIGYRSERSRQALAALRDVALVENPDYQRGAILSLWAARDFLDGPVLVMDADVFAPDAMIVRLVQSRQANCFLLDRRVAPSGEEQMLMAEGGRVLDISRRPRGRFDLLGESVGFLKLSAEAAQTMRRLLAARVEQGDLDIEHEEVYPELLAEVEVGFERVDDLDWTEIDFPADLERARDLAARSGGA